VQNLKISGINGIFFRWKLGSLASIVAAQLGLGIVAGGGVGIYSAGPRVVAWCMPTGWLESDLDLWCGGADATVRHRS
jgi:hypothetical protein